MSQHMDFLPYARQFIDDDDIAAVADALRDEYLTTGPRVAQFEACLQAITGARHTVACSNGTAALHLAAMALNLGPGDAVIVPSITFLATANAARYQNAEVIFADVDPGTGLMRAADVERALSRAGDLNVRAIFPVHLNGQPADMISVGQIAATHGLSVVEDCAHALGTKTRYANTWRPVGACDHSTLCTFSFHPVKAIAMGEGGAVTTNDAELGQRLNTLRNHGLLRDRSRFERQDLVYDSAGMPSNWYYEMQEFGYNYRLPDINCALGISQLAKLDKFLTRRRLLVDRYIECLKGLDPAIRPIDFVPDSEVGWHLFVVQIDFDALGVTRQAVTQRLAERKIGSQVHYFPVHRQPYYRHRYGDIDLPGAEHYYSRALSLPLFPAMSDDDPARVVDALKEILGIE